MKKLFKNKEPIINSLLETDTYKIRMLYFIWNFFPFLKTKFAFKNRSSVCLAKKIDIMELQEQIKEGKADGAKRYRENLEWYRENQRKVIKNWRMPEYNW